MILYKSFNPFKKGSRIIEKSRSSPLPLTLRKNGRIDESDIPFPLMKRGKGPYIYDYDDNRFVDFYLSNGSLLLGHSHPGITKIIKSWLNRGYASGYMAASHEALSKRAFRMLSGKNLDNEFKEGKWIYYDSCHEAAWSVLYILNCIGYSGTGIYIAKYDKPENCSPFDNILIKKVDPKDLNTVNFTNLNFVIIRIDEKISKAQTNILLKMQNEKGLIIISDETGFECHVHGIHNRTLLNNPDMRVFGSWISCGLSFGCVYAKSRLFKKIQDHNNSKLFQTTLLNSVPPIYKIKAVIASLKILEKYGAVEGLLKKNKYFYGMLNNKYFCLIDGLVYEKQSNFLTKEYKKIHSELLEKGFYFPLSPVSPVFISYSHSNELLEESAVRINLLFDGLYR